MNNMKVIILGCVIGGVMIVLVYIFLFFFDVLFNVVG